MKRSVFLFIFSCLLLVGCQHEHYPMIQENKPFIASVNMKEPSITFLDESYKKIATWQLKEAYTGATLIGHDELLLYGHELDHADIYELSSGKFKKKLDIGIGATNALSIKETKQFYIANSEKNTVTAFRLNGEKVKEVVTGKYPMTLIADENRLYVVNFKDTKLSVLDRQSLQTIATWKIPLSSTGGIIVNETLWLGGHGSGSTPNNTVVTLDKNSGKTLDSFRLPMMPVAFLQQQKKIYVLSHGQNKLYTVNEQGELLHEQMIAANPFALTSFQGNVVVAGYDDGMLYEIQRQKVTKKITVGEGPFQLIVREENANDFNRR